MDWKLEVVVLPVSDVDLAKRFYADQVGFAVDIDRSAEEIRLVQLTPQGSGCSVAIGEGLIESEPGSVKGLQLVVDDLDQAHTELVGRGVDVSTIKHFEDGEWRDGRGDPWNSFILFDDPDGNSWSVQERPPDS